MSTKTIAISSEAYERLKSLKKENESFTDVINRITRKRNLMEFAGMLSKEGAAALEADIRAGRALSLARAERQRKEFE